MNMAPRDFNDTYLALQDRLYRLAVGVVGDRDEAGDVVQDAYEKLWHRRTRVMERHNPEGYIIASVRNLCLDRLRSRRPRAQFTAAIEVAAGHGSGGGHTSDGEGDEGMVAIVEALVSALPEKQSTVMRLRDVECMEITEIAVVMGIRETAVRMALSRARGTVREKLVKIMEYGT